MRKLLLTFLLFVGISFSQGINTNVIYLIENLSFAGMAFADTYNVGSSTISINDVFTERGASAHKSIKVDLAYTPSAAGAAAPVGIASKVTLTSGMTYNAASDNYQGLAWGVQGQLHFPTGAAYVGSNNTDPGMLFAGLRGILTDDGTSTYTYGTMTAAYLESQVSQDVTAGAFRHFLLWCRNQGSGTATNIDAAIYIDEGDAWTNTIQIGIDMEDVVVGIEIDASETDIVLSDDSMIDGDVTNGATLNTTTGVTNVNYSAALNRTVVTLTDHVMDITDTGANGGHGALKILDFPEGYIRVEGVIGDIAVTTVSDIDADAVFDMAIGTATTLTSSEELGGANVTIVAKVDGDLVTSADTIDLVDTTTQDEDGHSGSTDVWFCVAVMGADIATNGTMTMSGTIVITWYNLGDY